MISEWWGLPCSKRIASLQHRVGVLLYSLCLRKVEFDDKIVVACIAENLFFLYTSLSENWQVDSFELNSRMEHQGSKVLPLYLALECASEEIVRLLIWQGAQVDFPINSTERRNFLHLAAQRNFFEIAQENILDVHQRLNERELDTSMTPIELAVASESYEMVEFLIEQGASIESVQSSMWIAVDTKNDNMLRLLLESRAEVMPGLLPRAAALGSLNCVETLLRHVSIDHIDGSGRTALMLAAAGGHEGVVWLLLDNYVDTLATDVDGMNCLHHAAHGGHPHIVKLFVEWQTLRQGNTKQCATPLQLAQRAGHEDAVQLLRNAKEDNMQVDRRYLLFEEIPTCAFAEGSYISDISEWAKMLECCSEDESDSDDALTRAVFRGDRVGATLQLASKEHDAVGTALLMALKNARFAWVDALLAMDDLDVSATDSSGATALHVASANGFRSATERLMKRGAAVDARDNNGWRPLHLAARNAHCAVVSALLARGADVDAEDDVGRTALHLAVRSRSEDCVRLLLERGADVDCADKRNNTPLHYAYEMRLDDVVRQLIARGAKARRPLSFLLPRLRDT